MESAGAGRQSPGRSRPDRSDGALASLPLPGDFKAELLRQIGEELEIEGGPVQTALGNGCDGGVLRGHQGSDGAPRSRSACGAAADDAGPSSSTSVEAAWICSNSCLTANR